MVQWFLFQLSPRNERSFLVERLLDRVVLYTGPVCGTAKVLNNSIEFLSDECAKREPKAVFRVHPVKLGAWYSLSAGCLLTPGI